MHFTQKVILSSPNSTDYGLDFEINWNRSGVLFYYQQNEVSYPSGIALLDITCKCNIFLTIIFHWLNFSLTVILLQFLFRVKYVREKLLCDCYKGSWKQFECPNIKEIVITSFFVQYWVWNERAPISRES